MATMLHQAWEAFQLADINGQSQLNALDVASFVTDFFQRAGSFFPDPLP